ncbi:lipopolysaccharide biosynthesis protein [Kaistella haifensis]|nr:lipopolysaccharide biosynthesis protein [Kaistella haifensis]
MAYERKQLINGVIWSGIDKLGVIVVQLILEIVLARHLLPADYGVIGIATIFIGLGSLFSESGFSNALIQKQDRDEQDFSTAFYFNLIISITFVSITFLIAPYASNFFSTPILTNVLRWLSVTIIFNSIVMVHKTKLSINLDFKTQAKISFVSLIISGSIGIALAIYGYGVWSLVVQIISLSVISAILLNYSLTWLPMTSFSIKSFKQLFGFGLKVLGAGLLHSIYVNLYYLFIGKKMSVSTLGIYTKSNQFTLMPASLISGILQRVMFPYFSSFQSDDNKIFQLNQNFTRIACLLIFPLFLFLASFARPLVYYGLSDKWLDAVDVIKILSFSMVFFPITVNNMILFQVKNKMNTFLYLEILSKVIGGIILLLTLSHGILALCYGILVQQVLQFFITSISVQLLLNKSIFKQILIVLPYCIYGGVFYACIYYFESTFSNGYFTFFIVGSLLFILFYFLLYFVILRKQIMSLIQLFKLK